MIEKINSAKFQESESEWDNKTLHKILAPHEPLRDPIHGDIWITLLERKIIDTRIFQNLRGRKQLAMTALVYPGATHTRFAHSIGTMYVANEIVKKCNENCSKFSESKLLEIEPYDRLVIRLVALLHDVAHIPFGHTLEREGNLFQNHEWDDPLRAEKILGEDSEIYRVIVDTLTLFKIHEQMAKTLIEELITFLTAKKEKIMDLDKPFIKDIIGNTLCADLLDYCVRDMYYCGLLERFGDRFLNYFGVLPLIKKENGKTNKDLYSVDSKGKGRLVLLSYRYERDRKDPLQSKAVKKRDVLSEAIDLLRKRYSLAEKAYFHRSKKAASAMIISAVNSANLNETELFNYSDDLLLNKLELSGGRAKRLIENLKRRNLYKPIYKVTYEEPDEYDDKRNKARDSILTKCRDPDTRLKITKKIEGINEKLAEGSIVIYCPDREMNTKEFDALVSSSPSADVKPLRVILDPVRKKEMDVINGLFPRLWDFQVLVDPELLDPTEAGNLEVRQVSGYCEEIFGLENKVEGLTNTIQDYYDKDLHQICLDAAKESEGIIPVPALMELKANIGRYPTREVRKKFLIEKAVKGNSRKIIRKSNKNARRDDFKERKT